MILYNINSSPNLQGRNKVQYVGLGIRMMGSGITVPRSGIRSRGIRISSFLRDQGSGIRRYHSVWDQGAKFAMLLESRIRTLGNKKMGSVTKNIPHYNPEFSEKKVYIF